MTEIQTQYLITVDPLLNSWSANHTRFAPGVYITEDYEIAVAATQTKMGVHVRELYPGEEVQGLGPYREDPTLTQGPLQTSDMAGGNNIRQRPSREAEFKDAETRPVEKAWDYSKDPSLQDDYVPHSQRTGEEVPTTPVPEAVAETPDEAETVGETPPEFDTETAYEEAAPDGVDI